MLSLLRYFSSKLQIDNSQEKQLNHLWDLFEFDVCGQPDKGKKF